MKAKKKKKSKKAKTPLAFDAVFDGLTLDTLNYFFSHGTSWPPVDEALPNPWWPQMVHSRSVLYKETAPARIEDRIEELRQSERGKASAAKRKAEPRPMSKLESYVREKSRTQSPGEILKQLEQRQARGDKTIWKDIGRKKLPSLSTVKRYAKKGFTEPVD